MCTFSRGVYGLDIGSRVYRYAKRSAETVIVLKLESSARSVVLNCRANQKAIRILAAVDGLRHANAKETTPQDHSGRQLEVHLAFQDDCTLGLRKIALWLGFDLGWTARLEVFERPLVEQPRSPRNYSVYPTLECINTADHPTRADAEGGDLTQVRIQRRWLLLAGFSPDDHSMSKLSC